MGYQTVGVTRHPTNYTWQWQWQFPQNSSWHELVQSALKLIYDNADFRKFSSLFYLLFYLLLSVSGVTAEHEFSKLNLSNNHLRISFTDDRVKHFQHSQCELCYPQRRI
jgi:hypothetical protein